MSRRPMFPNLDPALVVPSAKFLKNSAEYRGKGVLDIVERVIDFVGADGPYQRVHYRNTATGRSASMLMTDFCQGSEHLPAPPEEPVTEPAIMPAETGPLDLEAEVRALRAGQAEILTRLDRVLKLFPPQLSLIG